MGSDISDVRYPDLIWLSHIELELKIIRCNHCRLATIMTGTATITGL